MSINGTEAHHYDKEIIEALSRASKLYEIFIPIFGAIIVVANGLVVTSSGLILHKRQQPRSTYIFLGNISLADMLTGVTVIFGLYYQKTHRSEMICSVAIGMIVSATLVSIHSIGLIAIDRFFYILCALRYQRVMTWRRARFMVVGTWLFGLFIGFLPAMGLRNPTEDGKYCWLLVLEPKGLLLTTVGIAMVPLIMIMILYGIILKRALRKISEIRQNEMASSLTGTREVCGLRYFRGGSQNRKTNGSFDSSSTDGVSYIQEEMVFEMQSKSRSIFRCCRKSNMVKISSVYSTSRWKAIKIVVFTTGSFVVTWFPYFLACGLYALCDPDFNSEFCDNLRVAIGSPLGILGLMNSLLNPIIYAWWHNGFRTSAKRIFNGIWKRNVEPNNETLQRGRMSVEAKGCTQRKLSESTDLDADFDATESKQMPAVEARNNSVILGVLEL